MTRRTYKVNIKRLALLTLPTWLRRPIVGALIYAGVTPLNRLLQELRTLREETSYRVNHNGQVCKLRGALNDVFDAKKRRIKVEDEDSGGTEGARVYLRSEERELPVPERSTGRAVIINGRGYGGVSGYDFWVTLPRALRGDIDETRLTATVNRYKLASKRWTINYE